MFVALGCVIGTIVGALPGIGPPTAIAILIPLTYSLPPVTALIMLAGIYFGGVHGGIISAVLMNTPGHPDSIVTAIEGYPLARKGRGGAVLSLAAVSSLAGGLFALILVIFLADPIASFAVNFGPPESAALLLLALVAVGGLSRGARLKGIMMGAFGVLLSFVGLDSASGVARYTFGNENLLSGIPFMPVIIGVFALAEVMRQARRGYSPTLKIKLRDMIFTREEWSRSWRAMGRSAPLGFLLGVVPGAGPTVASFVSYDVAIRRSKHPERFGSGEGMIEGIMSAETANNSAALASFIPTLTLGIPGSGTTAVMLGAFILYGIQPGPLIFRDQPTLAWGLIASFLVANVVLLVINGPLGPVFAMVLRLKYQLIYPFILVAALIGAFASNGIFFDEWLAVVFGAIGYVVSRLDYPLAPLIIGVIFGSTLNTNLIETSQILNSPLQVFDHPIVDGIIVLGIAIFVVPPLLKRVWGGVAGRGAPIEQPSAVEP